MSELYRKLIEYSQSDYYPFHMPGHKRNVNDGLNPYKYDITEIEGFDNLHEPQGILRIAMEEAARFYESDKTYFLVNGSTCGILAAISGTVVKHDKIIAARNCHKSVYNAMYINELVPIYVYPHYVERYGINGGIMREDVEIAMDDNQEAKVVVITSPTYEGIVSDIADIARTVHEHGGILIVDEAHGAHFGMNPEFPGNALSNGADIVIQSIHKTLPSLTQTALLHIKSNRIDIEKVERFLRIYQTSSPSYVLISSITECIDKIKTDSIFMFEPYVKRLMAIKRYAKELTHLKLMGEEIVGNNGVYDLDISKIVMSVRGTGYSGKWLYNYVLEKNHLQLEMAAGDYAIAMTSPMDTEEGLLRLFTAIAEADRDIRIYGNGRYNVSEDYRMQKVIAPENIYNAVNADSESVLLRRAEGKISAEYIYLYPPGCPIVAPGELITGELISLMERYKAGGLTLHGGNNGYIKVVKEDFKSLNLIKEIY